MFFNLKTIKKIAEFKFYILFLNNINFKEINKHQKYKRFILILFNDFMTSYINEFCMSYEVR